MGLVTAIEDLLRSAADRIGPPASSLEDMGTGADRGGARCAIGPGRPAIRGDVERLVESFEGAQRRMYAARRVRWLAWPRTQSASAGAETIGLDRAALLGGARVRTGGACGPTREHHGLFAGVVRAAAAGGAHGVARAVDLCDRTDHHVQHQPDRSRPRVLRALLRPRQGRMRVQPAGLAGRPDRLLPLGLDRWDLHEHELANRLARLDEGAAVSYTHLRAHETR